MAEKGYGTLDQIEQWDSDRFLDILEIISIKNQIESYTIQEARNGNC